MTMRLDISLGPVQSFIANSRRTRDLWGSSYLLSFLSGHAMCGACEAGGKVIQPIVDDDPIYRWIQGKKSGKPPKIGTLPNHFVVEITADVDATAITNAAKRAADMAWGRLSQTVWDRYVHQASVDGNQTEEIWKRQIDGFWKLVWVLNPVGGSQGLLARRKHWRSDWLPDEPGDKCTVMPDLQELSGYIRSCGAESRKSQDQFWKQLCREVGSLDIGEKERLCSIALIKRLFPKLSGECLGWTLDAIHWPSTVYISAVPWMRRVMASAPEEARQYAEMVRKYVPSALSEYCSPIKAVGGDGSGRFQKLDGNYFHCEQMNDAQICSMGEDEAETIRQKLADSLRLIYDARDENGNRLGSPPSFYALLLADGDSLGKLVGTLGSEHVGKALASFTKEVPKVVEGHCGVTIYAGGDDVMAMLPVTEALSCAAALALGYRAAFREQPKATLSATVLFAHIRSPLSTVLSTAHRLLDDVAKDGNGRDSLVAAVVNPGGLSCQWVTTWQRASTGKRRSSDTSAVYLLNELAGKLKEDAAEPGLSSVLIYRIREMLSDLCGWAKWTPGEWGSPSKGLDDIRHFLYSEVLHSLTIRIEEGVKDHTEGLTDLLLSLLARSQSPDAPGLGRDDSSEVSSDTVKASSRNAEVGIDALLLARFLTNPEHAKEQ